ncbi:sterol carrier protein 2-like [Watersipora subatra]|uniref:sterol carrier protein 2-like n=1 Tax=Watersipora subatra TaxID=2589382 RepID=UPI00355C5C6D
MRSPNTTEHWKRNTIAMGLKRRVFVVGVGMTKFDKPGAKEGDYPDWGKEAGERALKDAGLSYGQIQQACCSYVYGDTTAGQRVVYGLGMTGIPVYNVNNACSSGSTALMMARQFVEGGLAECALALGFEKMERGSLSNKYDDRVNPMEKHVAAMFEVMEPESSPLAPQMFGNAGREHMKRYGTTADQFAKVAYKNHKHSVNNPYAQFQRHYTIDEIKASRMIHDPLTKLQCSPTSDGAAAVILASEPFVKKHGLESKAVEILAQEMVTDTPSTFESNSVMNIVGYDMSKMAADKVYKCSGVKPDDIDVVELHDCFSTNELITYEALGLCAPGEGGKMVDRGDNTYGGKYVVNPSGGLESKGHPLGATGLAQCSELTWQLRGEAGKRQVSEAKLALQHNIGLGGAAVVTLYKLGFPTKLHNPSAVSGDVFECAPLFAEMANILKKGGAVIVKKIRGTYSFKVKNSTGKELVWFVNCKTGSGFIEVGSDKKADCTISVSDKDLVDLLSGKLDGQKAFMQGKLKITGNIMLATKLKELQLVAPNSKL